MEAVAEVKKSTSKVEIVPVNLEKHPNADSLSIVRVFDYQVCVRTEDWLRVPEVNGVRLGAYIPPDNICPDTPDFEFLGDKKRIKAKKLRGIVSFGLLMPAPKGSVLGDDVSDKLGITHYEPPTGFEQREKGGLVMGGEVETPPKAYTVKYDVDAFRRYAQIVFTPGEPVIVTEKLDGANSRYVYEDGNMHCGSRTEWKREYPTYSHVTKEYLVSKGKTEQEADEILSKLQNKTKVPNMWWLLLHKTPTLEAFCTNNPGLVVYGEAYGQVQKLTYGHKKGDISFAAFDVMDNGSWMDPITARDMLIKANVPCVPLVGLIDYDFDKICEMAEGQSLIPGANHMREGIVVEPIKVRYDDKIGRVKLKVVSGEYLEKYR